MSERISTDRLAAIRAAVEQPARLWFSGDKQTRDYAMIAVEDARDLLADLDEIRGLIRELADGISWWGQQEDGIPPEVWEAFKKARRVAPWSPSKLLPGPVVTKGEPHATN